MNVLYGIMCLVMGLISLVYTLINREHLLDTFRDLESDKGISFYKMLIGSLMIIILGIYLIVKG